MAEHGLSQRRACALAEVDSKTVRRGPIPDSPEIRARVRALAGERRRFGYRRLGILLEREALPSLHRGGAVGPATTWSQARDRHADADDDPAGAEPALVAGRRPSGSNPWRLDGQLSDVLSWGGRFRVLAVVDDFTREALALVVDSSIPGGRVVRELEALIAGRGAPLMIVSDNGTELTSRAVLDWTNRTGIEWRPPWALDRDGGHMSNHRAGQAAAERLRRELQRPVPRRMLERRGLPLDGRGTRGDRENGGATSTPPGRTPLMAD